MGRCSFLWFGGLLSVLLIGLFEWQSGRGIFTVEPCMRFTSDDLAAAKQAALIPNHHGVPVTILLTTPPAAAAAAAKSSKNNNNDVYMSVTQLTEDVAKATLSRTTTHHMPPDIPSRTIITVPANYPSHINNNNNDIVKPSSTSAASVDGARLWLSRGCGACGGVTLVTGVSNVGIQSVANLVGSIHRYVPDCPLIIYDMGLQSEYRSDIEQWRNVYVRNSPVALFTTLQYSVIRPWLIRDTFTLVDTLTNEKDTPAGAGCPLHSTKVLWVDPDYEFARSSIDGIIDAIETRGHYFNTRGPLGCSLSIQGYQKGSKLLAKLLASLPAPSCGNEELCVATLVKQERPTDIECADKAPAHPYLIPRPPHLPKSWLNYIRKSRPFAIVMPFMNDQVNDILDAFEYWGDYLPCHIRTSDGHHYNHYSTPNGASLILPDLYLYNSRRLPAADKQRLTIAFFEDERIWQCFRSLRFVDADHHEKEDIRPLNINKQFLAVIHSPLFTPLRKSHDYVFFMTPDTHPIRDNWLWSLHHATYNDPTPYWAKGDCWEGVIAPNDKLENRMHIGSASLWSLSPEFATFLHAVYQKYDGLPFEAEIYRFLNKNYGALRDTFHMFRYSKLIINMGTLPWNAAQIRDWFPDAAVVSGRMRVNEPVINIHGAEAFNPSAAALPQVATPSSTQAIYHAAVHGVTLPSGTLISQAKPPQRLAPTAAPSLNHSGQAHVRIAAKPLSHAAAKPSKRSSKKVAPSLAPSKAPVTVSLEGPTHDDFRN